MHHAVPELACRFTAMEHISKTRHATILVLEICYARGKSVNESEKSVVFETHAKSM